MEQIEANYDILNTAFEKSKANQQGYISEIKAKREQILNLEV